MKRGVQVACAAAIVGLSIVAPGFAVPAGATPVSGAVVLETKQQYDEAGLQPVPPGSVPTVPEPETWLLIIVALGVLGLRLRKRAA